MRAACVPQVLLTGIVVFFPRGSIGQLLVGLMLSIVLSWLVHHIKPYRSKFDDVLAQVAQGVVIFVIISKIMLQDMARHGTAPTWLPLVETMLVSLRTCMPSEGQRPNSLLLLPLSIISNLPQPFDSPLPSHTPLSQSCCRLSWPFA